MKHIITDINDSNEPVLFSEPIVGNYCVDTDFGNFSIEKLSFLNFEQQSELFSCTHMATLYTLYLTSFE